MKSLTSLKNFDVDNINVADYTLLSFGSQVGLWSYFGNKKISFDEVIRHYQKYGRVMTALLYALVAYGYLIRDRDNNLYINPKHQKILTADNSVVLNNYDWYFIIAQAPSIIKESKEPTISSNTYNCFIDISESLSKTVFPEIIREHPSLIKDDHLLILDVGCGKMGLLRSLLKVNKSIEAIAIEKNDYALKFLRSTLKEENIENKVALIEGDVMEKINFIEEKFDFIIISHVLHWLNGKDCQTLLDKCKLLLKPKGVCLIYEDYLNKERMGPKSSVRKNLSLAIMGYQIFSKTELISLLENSGFGHIWSRILMKRRILFSCS